MIFFIFIYWHDYVVLQRYFAKILRAYSEVSIEEMKRQSDHTLEVDKHHNEYCQGSINLIIKFIAYQKCNEWAVDRKVALEIKIQKFTYKTWLPALDLQILLNKRYHKWQMLALDIYKYQYKISFVLLSDRSGMNY